MTLHVRIDFYMKYTGIVQIKGHTLFQEEIIMTFK